MTTLKCKLIIVSSLFARHLAVVKFPAFSFQACNVLSSNKSSPSSTYMQNQRSHEHKGTRKQKFLPGDDGNLQN